MSKQICIDIVNDFRSKNGLETIKPNKAEVDSIKLFSDLWRKFGLSDYGIEPSKRNFSFNDKFDCLIKWAEIIFPANTVDINFILRKILNGRSTIAFEQKSDFLTATSLVLYEIDNRKIEVDFSDLIPFEIDNQFKDIDELSREEINEMKFKDCIQTAEQNLSYGADEIALKYFKMALEIKSFDNETNHTYNTLDKIVNHNNYKYPIDDRKTLELCKIFIDCCNVKGFERLYDLISDDFVCISKYFGRTKKAFIDSIYFERKSWQGLTTKIGLYSNDEKKTPCVILNDFGILLFDIESEKIVRAIENKIGETIDKNKVTEWEE
jgi:hypothetical protein